MRYTTRVLWLALSSGPASSLAAERVWITVLPELAVACDSVAVSPSDRKAVVERIAAFQAALSGQDGSDVAIFVRPSADDEKKVVACALNPGDGADVARVTLPSGPALIAYCSSADADACQAAMGATVGDSWRGIRWAVPRLAWVQEGDPTPPPSLGREASELLALGVQPQRVSPNATAMLQAVGEVHVLRLTADQASVLVAAVPTQDAAADPAAVADAAPGAAPPVATPRIERVDALQHYLECNNAALPAAFGVLSDPGADVLETIDHGEQEGGWRLAISPARVVFGLPVSEVTAYVGERYNYRVAEFSVDANAVRDQISLVLDEAWDEVPFGEGWLIREDLPLGTVTYHFARRDIVVLPQGAGKTWVICQGDDGSGDADLPEQPERRMRPTPPLPRTTDR